MLPVDSPPGLPAELPSTYPLRPLQFVVDVDARPQGVAMARHFPGRWRVFFVPERERPTGSDGPLRRAGRLRNRPAKGLRPPGLSQRPLEALP